jgi:hypothetical protein
MKTFKNSENTVKKSILVLDNNSKYTYKGFHASKIKKDNIILKNRKTRSKITFTIKTKKNAKIKNKNK